MRVLGACEPGMEHGCLFFLQLTLIQEDTECIMLPFPVTMGADRSQGVKGMN